MNKIFKLFVFTAVIISSSFLLSACGSKNTSSSIPTKASTKKATEIQLADNEKPYISLIPTADGHTLSFKMTSIPTKFSTVEYELIYTAKDQNLEIEKGVSGTVKLEGATNLTKDLLLGTASCTNGCKYKYDEGVTNGTLNITLKTDNNEYTSYTSPFTLKSGVDLNKEKKLVVDSLTINGTATTKGEYFIALKNFGSQYSVFSSGSGKGKITSVEPSTVTKKDLNSLAGDYTIAQ